MLSALRRLRFGSDCVANGYQRLQAVRSPKGCWTRLRVRYCWLQEQLANEAYSVKKISRENNASDVMTHAPSASELAKFLPGIGVFQKERADGPVRLAKTALATRPNSSVKLAAAVLACLMGSTRSESCHEIALSSPGPFQREAGPFTFLLPLLLLAVACLLDGAVAGWKLRGWWLDRPWLVVAAPPPPQPQSGSALAIADGP